MMKISDRIIAPSRGSAAEAAVYATKAGAYRLPDVVAYITEVFRLARILGIDASIPIAQSVHETSAWTSQWWLQRLNPAGIGITGDPKQNLESRTWTSGVASARSHLAHLILYATGKIEGGGLTSDDDPRYGAYRSAYKETIQAQTISDLTNKWATDDLYDQGIVRRGNEVYPELPDQTAVTIPEEGPMATVNIVGFGPVELDVPFTADIVPANMKNQRTGIAMKPDRWIQHETGNTSPGANAMSERNYLHGGGGGQKVSYHFAVDDTRIIQLIPVNEVAWHGGDGAGPCNMKGIASELCVGANLNKAKARSNAEKLAAALTKAMNIPLANVLQHNVCYGKDCPHFMRVEGYWPTFIANVTALRGTPPKPEIVTPDPVGDEGTGKESTRIDKNGVPWVYSRRPVVPVRAVQTYKYADPTSGDGLILPAGKSVLAYYTTSVADPVTGKPEIWLTTRKGWRFRLRDALAA